MRRAAAIATLGIAACLAGPAAAQDAERLPPDAVIAGVPVGGLGPTEAEREVRRVFGGWYRRAVGIRLGSRDQTVVPADAGLRIGYKAMVEAAFEAARSGRRVDVRRRIAIRKKAFGATVARVARPFYRAPRNARAVFGITKVKRIRARNGYALDTRLLRRRLGRELRTPSEERVVEVRRVRIRPAVTTAGLRRRYPAYISIDRANFTLRLFRGLRHVRTYKVAVGTWGYETPRGMRAVLSRQKNPSWTAPNRPWAAPYQGQTFPPGHPNNPLKAWFLSLGDGYGIHGTTSEWTIGTRASHGCIRMRERDVNRLAPLVPVGTPVRIR